MRVVSIAVSLFAVTSVPSERSARPLTPAIGAVTRVYERFSSASFSFARAEAIAAEDCFSVASAWSSSRCEMAFSRASGSRRAASVRASSRRTCSCCSAALASCTASS